MTHGPLRLAVVGDSLAYGTGAARPADTLGPRLARVLQRAGHAVEVHVVAVPGATSLELAAQVRRPSPSTPTSRWSWSARTTSPASSPRAVRGRARRGGRTLRGAGVTVVAHRRPTCRACPACPAALRPVLRGASDELQRRQAARPRRRAPSSPRSPGSSSMPSRAARAVLRRPLPSLVGGLRAHRRGTGAARRHGRPRRPSCAAPQPDDLLSLDDRSAVRGRDLGQRVESAQRVVLGEGLQRQGDLVDAGIREAGQRAASVSAANTVNGTLSRPCSVSHPAPA